MEEVAATPWNGYNVVSTFSGCGGSCLGFEMAGFKVRWASEFIPAAQEVYRLNHSGVPLDTQDIREVSPEAVLAASGLKAGELDVMEGSPPCASFSMAGKRAKGWGEVKQYSDTKQRTDDLFWEYARLVKALQPKVFVAENVAGLVRGVAKGYFKRILAELKACGYNVQCRILDAQWLGVPQARQRTIFIGVRNDLGLDPAFPKPLGYRYSVRDALPWIVTAELANGMESIGNGTGHLWKDVSAGPFPTVQQGRPVKVEAETDISRYAIGAEWEQLPPGGSVWYGGRLWEPDVLMPCPTVTQTGGNTGAASVAHPTEKRKFSIAELKRICAFPDDFQLTGTYAQQWERLGRAVPPLMMRAVAEVVRDEILAKVKE